MQHTLPRLDIPTFFIWGENDEFAPASLGRQLEPMLPRVRFKYIAEAGHQVQTDQPKIVADLMVDFFSA